MKIILKQLTTFSLILLLLSSCKKDEITGAKFTWTYDGLNYVAVQHTAYTSGIGAPYIVAGLQSSVAAPGTGPRVKVASLQPGTYSFGPSSSNRFLYIDGAGDTYEAVEGNFSISRNANGTMDGNFFVKLTNNKVVTGVFTYTPIKP